MGDRAAAPTRQAYEVFDHLSRLLDAELEQMTLIFQQDLAQLNELLRSLGMDPIDTENLITGETLRWLSSQSASTWRYRCAIG